MKRVLLRVAPATLLSAVLLASAAWSMGPHPREFDHERLLDRMTEHLELSEAQVQQVRAVLEEDGAQMQADRSRMQEIRDALQSQRGSFDAGAAQVLAQELGEITARMAYSATSKHARVYQLLDEDQREEMAAMRARRGERMERHWSRKLD